MRYLILLFFIQFVISTNSSYAQTRLHFNQNDINLILEEHNKERRIIGSENLTWDYELADYAYEWASNLAKINNGIWHRTHDYGKNYGENIAYYYGKTYTADYGVKLWNTEKKDYIYSPISYSNFNQTGHYTQIIWENTQRVGCACAISTTGAYFYVCNYDPPGNYIGQYPYTKKIMIKESANNNISYTGLSDEKPENISSNIQHHTQSNEEYEPSSENVSYSDNSSKRKTAIENSEIFSFKVGSQLTYPIDDLNIPFNNLNSSLLSGSVNAMLGIRYGKGRKKNVFGITGTLGKNNLNNTIQPKSFFYEIEAGFILNEWLRLSGGRGLLNYNTPGGVKTDYTSITTGFLIGPKGFKIECNNTAILPNDQNTINLRISLGLSIVLNFGKRYE
ncbi:MAG: hypothetical protein FGM46_08720 [Ferruginibacter sp.]|nr:hypothetical protein [Ferruginibacter sp.]